MRKRIIAQGTQAVIPPDKDWLDVENLAQAELTSEDASHPIESALKPGVGSGWQASEPGCRAWSYRKGWLSKHSLIQTFRASCRVIQSAWSKS